ncbi:Fic family protein [Janibacter anophelis]|uniref:Fic family protein n=1 Tax=Janibacter anophelis TaxID=319054 RepID=UPI000DEF4793|nr:Fic family protein [Janibacter anophelis]
MTRHQLWATHRESLAWERDPSRPMSRSERARVGSTYEATITPDIARLQPTIGARTLAAADDARAEISRFDAQLSTMLPGTELAPLAAVLLRTESASSSQIEQVTAGARALALAELDLAPTGSNAQLVAANVEAMTCAVHLADDVTPQSLLAIHDALMRDQPHAAPGRFRTEQVWVGGSSVSPHGATFVAPAHERVEPAVEDLCAFVARTDIPLLPQCAIAHAQLETIHPFNDGNGRVGRALVHAMLQQGGATTRATVPVSAGLLADTHSYFDALTSYRLGDVDPIIDRFVEATFAAVGNGRELARDLVEIHTGWTERIRARRDASIWRALPLLLSQPVITSALLQQELSLSQPAADQIIARLREAEVLTRATGRQRYVTWTASEVTAALDAFAERARRG